MAPALLSQRPREKHPKTPRHGSSAADIDKAMRLHYFETIVGRRTDDLSFHS